MKYLINLVYLLALIGYSPLLIYRIIKQDRYRKGWGNRFGKVVRKNPAAKCIWIHAVSVGEVNATKTIVEQLSKKLPNCEIAISTTTDTGYARANALYGNERCVFFFPFDFSFAMSKAFRLLNPSLCILMELEVWPNFINEAKKHNTAIMVANGRISDNSFPSYKKVKKLIKPIFAKLDIVLAQTQEYAERFIDLGCNKDKVKISSSLKYDTAQIADKIKGSDEIAEKLKMHGQKLIVAGGTGPGEEKLILEVYKKILAKEISEDLRLAIVPRKPERFDEVAVIIKDMGLKICRYSQYKDNTNPAPVSESSVILVDTMGDLRKFYSLSDISFVGRSLVPMGGSDMIESAALGKVTIFGKHTFNFKHTVEVLLQGNGAIEVGDTIQLYQAFKKCLEDAEYAKTIANNGQNVIRNNQGATEKTVQAVLELIV